MHVAGSEETEGVTTNRIGGIANGLWRSLGWQDPTELEAVGARLREVGQASTPDGVGDQNEGGGLGITKKTF